MAEMNVIPLFGIKRGPRGARMQGLRPEMVPAMLATYSVYIQIGYPCIITSGVEGKHKRQSAHYSGRAFDVRTKRVGMSSVVATRAKTMIQLQLHEDYQVIVEGDHLHVEFDPATPVNYYFKSSG